VLLSLCRAAFACSAHANGKPTRDKGNNEHHDKCYEIFNVMDCKGVVRWHEEEIKSGNAQKRGEKRRALPVRLADDYYQVYIHCNVDQVK